MARRIAKLISIALSSHGSSRMQHCAVAILLASFDGDGRRHASDARHGDGRPGHDTCFGGSAGVRGAGRAEPRRG